jgi:translocation and assembly module TamA
VTVTPGDRYHLKSYEVKWLSGTAPAALDLSPGLAMGMPAEARPIADAQARLVEALQTQGRPFARVVDRVARIDRREKTMDVTLTLDAGGLTRFGPTTIAGLADLDPAFVRGKIPWEEGERFDRSRIDALRTTLLALGLFASVKIEHAEAARADGSLPVTIALVEGLHRSIGAGAAYSTSEGFLLDVFWEHRNLFGAAEKLRLSGTAGTLTQRAMAEFRKPDFRRVDQDLLANSALVRTDSDAFDETSWANYLGLERKLSERWRASAGGSFELARLTDRQSTETVQLFGVPLLATRDNRDDVLNPTKGSLLGFELVPYGGHGSEALTFLHSRVSASSYIALDRRRRIVVAGRTRVASVFGEERAVIPANKRLYAGGGGSIRGYEFQKVGPLDGENDPLGGRSLFEIGLELRLRVTEEIGIVPFVEGGNVWDDTVPDPLGHLQWAGGLGLRYHTPIGPARVDFAVPLNKRRNIDDDFQVYFSLGQAF